MSRRVHLQDDSFGPPLSPGDLERVVACCDDFATSWIEGARLQVESEVEAAPKELQARLFRMLIALGAELRQRDFEARAPRSEPGLAPSPKHWALTDEWTTMVLPSSAPFP